MRLCDRTRSRIERKIAESRHLGRFEEGTHSRSFIAIHLRENDCFDMGEESRHLVERLEHELRVLVLGNVHENESIAFLGFLQEVRMIVIGQVIHKIRSRSILCLD